MPCTPPPGGVEEEQTKKRGLGVVYGTGRATGGFRAQFGTTVNVQLSLLAREALGRFKDEIGADPGYVQAGYLWLAQSEADREALRAALRVQHECGLTEAAEIGLDEIGRLNPALDRRGQRLDHHAAVDEPDRALHVARREGAEQLTDDLEVALAQRGRRVVHRRGRARQGWVHLAVLLDLYSRRVVGWSMNEKPTRQLATDALVMALARRQPSPGLLHHSDQGILYATASYRHILRTHGLIPSMSRKANCYDNAVAESFFSGLKNELIWHRDFRTRDEARSAIFEWIEVFYNRERLHQALDYVSPTRFEEQTGVA